MDPGYRKDMGTPVTLKSFVDIFIYQRLVSEQNAEEKSFCIRLHVFVKAGRKHILKPLRKYGQAFLMPDHFKVRVLGINYSYDTFGS